MTDPLQDFESRVVVLSLDVDRLTREMQTESESARRALGCYGRAKHLLNTFLGRAANHQSRACHLGRRLTVCKDCLGNLQREWDRLAWDPSAQDQEELEITKRELRRIGEMIRHWSVESDDKG